MKTSFLCRRVLLTGCLNFIVVAVIVIGLPLNTTCASWHDLPWVNFGEYNARILCSENVDLSRKDILYDNRIGALYLADQNQTPVVGMDPTILLIMARGAAIELSRDPSYSSIDPYDVTWSPRQNYMCATPACISDRTREVSVFTDLLLKRGLDNFEHRAGMWADVILAAALQPDISQDSSEKQILMDRAQQIMEASSTGANVIDCIKLGQGVFQAGEWVLLNKRSSSDWQKLLKDEGPLSEAMEGLGTVLDGLGTTTKVSGDAMRKMYLQSLATADAEVRLRAMERLLPTIPNIDEALLTGLYNARTMFNIRKGQQYKDMNAALISSIVDNAVDETKFLAEILIAWKSAYLEGVLGPWFLLEAGCESFVDREYDIQRCSLMATLNDALVTVHCAIVAKLRTDDVLAQTDVEDALSLRDTELYTAWYFYDSLRNWLSGNFLGLPLGDLYALVDQDLSQYMNYVNTKRNWCSGTHQLRRYPGTNGPERANLITLIRPVAEMTAVTTGAPLSPGQAAVAYRVLGDRAGVGYYTARMQLDSQASATVALDGGSKIFDGVSTGSHGIRLWVEGRNGLQIDGSLSTISFTMGYMSVPSPVDLVAHAGNSRVDLSWIVPNVGEQGFNVWRGNCSGGPYIKLNGTPVVGSTYTDTGVTNGQLYFYVVRTVQGGNESANSNEVSAIPVAQDRQGPTISNIRQEPQSPTVSDTVNIFADITDPSGVGGAEIHWWKQGMITIWETGWIEMARVSGNSWRTRDPIGTWPSGTKINYEISTYDGNRYVSNSEVYSYTVGAVLDKQPPALYGVSPALGSTVYTARPRIECRIVDNSGIGAVDEDQIIIKVDNVDVIADAHRNDDEVTYKPDTNLVDGLHTVWVSIPDMSHNVSTYQWQFTVDTTPQTGNLIEHFDTIVPTYGHDVNSFDIWQDYVAWVDKTENRVRLYNLKTQQEIWQSPSSQVPSDNPIRLNDGKLVYLDTAPSPDMFYVYDISSETLTNITWTYYNAPMNPDISGKYITFESLDAAHQNDYIWVKDIVSGQIYQGPQNGMCPRIEGAKVLYQTGEDIRLWDFISGSDTVVCNQSDVQGRASIANGFCIFQNKITNPYSAAMMTLKGLGYQQLSSGYAIGWPDIDDRYTVWVEEGTAGAEACENVWIYDYIKPNWYQLTAGIADVATDEFCSPKVSGNRVAYHDRTGVNRIVVAELVTENVWPQAIVFAATDMTHFDGLAVDEADNVYISGRRNSDDKVVKYDPNGNFQFDFGTESQMGNPHGLDAKNGTVYVGAGATYTGHLVKYSDFGVYLGDYTGVPGSPADVAIRNDGHVFALTISSVRHYDANMVFVEDVTKSMLGLGTLNSCATTEDGKLVVADTSDRISVWDLNSEHLIGSVSNAGRYVATWKDKFVYAADQGCCISILNIGSGTPTLLVDGHYNTGWDYGVLRDITGLGSKYYFEDPKYIDIGPLGEVYFYNNYTGYEGVVKLPPFFYSDTSAPTITVLSPANGGTTASGVLRFQITDNLVGVDETAMRVYLDDQDISGMFVQQGGIYNAELVAGSHPLMNGNHVLKIRAADYAGNTQVTNVAFTIDTKPPAPITFFTAFDTGIGGSIQLNWTSYVETNEPNLAGYNVFASLSPISVTNGLQPVNPTLIPLGTKTYQVTGLTNETAYYFAIVSVDSLGNVAEIVVNAGPIVPHAQPLPDLYVSPSDVVFEPNLLTQGISSDIIITIHNCGLAAADGFGLAVYLGDPNQGGIRIDDGTISLNAAMGGTATASIPYIPVNIGWEQLFVILDPSNTIQEQNKANNSTVIGGYVSAPIAPAGDFDGNGWENLTDFAIFASAWMSQPGQPNWNPACDISSPKDDIIDWSDFAVFIEYWLTGIEYSPPTISAGDFDGNGKEDLMDFVIFASAWMSQPGDISWNPTCDISDPKDSIIDWKDLAVFSKNWLVGTE